MKLLIPNYVENAINCLESNGFEAFVVGGAVRDVIIGKTPTDWDITTNALPSDIKRVFKKTFDTGIKHGTVTVLIDGETIEITTYRIDGKYLDNRRPDNIEFTQNLKDDLKRRDFTINALAYNNNLGIVDAFGGTEDLQNKIIRCVGDPNCRFNEDALRILRAIRFAVTLGYNIEDKTYNAICENKFLLKSISAERIRDELDKILLCDCNLDILYESGILHVILPEVYDCFDVQQNNPHHIYDVGRHTFKVVNGVPQKLSLKYAALLHDVGKAKTKTIDDKGIDHFYSHCKVSVELAYEILNRLKFDNDTKGDIINLIKYHDMDILETHKHIKKFVSKLGANLFSDLLKLKRADAIAQNPDYLNEKLCVLDNINDIFNSILNEKHPLNLKDLKVNGNDMINIGYCGKQIGVILSTLLDIVHENPTLNHKEVLINIAKHKLY